MDKYQCEERYEELYGHAPEARAFCPYRVCPIGAHSDHNLGKITGFAIDKGIYMAYGTKQNGVIEVASLNFPKRAQWHVSSVPDVKTGDWADYLRGATMELAKRYPLTRGLSGVIEGTLPIGGLSSSHAVTLAFLLALCKVNQIKPTVQELIEITMASENHYVGVASGKLDQSCEILCKKNHLLYLDTKDDSYELIPVNPSMKPFKIAIFFSGVERSLAGSAFNMRVDEARSAAYALKAFAGLPYGKFAETNLRDIPRSVYDVHKDRLPKNWYKRAEHWFSEFARVEKGAAAWKKGDLETYGQLSFESGHSSIVNWETGSPELRRLYEIMLETEGIYGGRFSGAGFKGCCMALINPEYQDSIREQVTEKYLASFPELASKFSVHFCDTADGIGEQLQ